MILVDTSVWIDHLRSPDPELVRLLEQDEVVIHPFVIGELACGNLRNRAELLSLWGNLQTCATATDDEALAFIENRKLMGAGLGYVDVHLLAAAALGGTVKLWTRDKPLATAATKLGMMMRA